MEVRKIAPLSRQFADNLIHFEHLPSVCWNRDQRMEHAIRVVTDIGIAKQISACLSIVMREHDIFKALADPTRRAIFEKLADARMNASGLREGMNISQPAMSQHLAVLCNAKLVLQERQGRCVNYEVDPDGLMYIVGWLAKYRAYWPERIDALKSLIKDMDQ